MTQQPPVKRLRSDTKEFLKEVDDLRIVHISPLLPPAYVLEEQPVTKEIAALVSNSRQTVQNILTKKDDRVFVVVGPCSIHDVKAGMDYANEMKKLSDELKDDVFIIMRTYFEKPRTTVGWKGLINDPNLDGSFKINAGIKLARQFLLDVNNLGLPCAGEFLDTITPQFVADLVSWGAIGSTTTESQVHRELASGLSCPVGFKNATEGDIQKAVDGCLSSSNGHSFLSVTKDGIAAIVHTSGNKTSHIVLRGGSSGPNYQKPFVDLAKEKMKQSGISTGIMIDCSHENSKQNYRNQPILCRSIGEQIAAGEKDIVGVMLESHLVDGSQELEIGVTDVKSLTYGVSVTGACIDYKRTQEVLRNLAKSVQARRKVNTNGSSK